MAFGLLVNADICHIQQRMKEMAGDNPFILMTINGFDLLRKKKIVIAISPHQQRDITFELTKMSAAMQNQVPGIVKKILTMI